MHKMSCFIKGTLVGFAVGAAVGVMTDPLSDRERRKISKKTEGIFRNIGSVMDNIISIKHKTRLRKIVSLVFSIILLKYLFRDT